MKGLILPVKVTCSAGSTAAAITGSPMRGDGIAPAVTAGSWLVVDMGAEAFAQVPVAADADTDTTLTLLHPLPSAVKEAAGFVVADPDKDSVAIATMQAVQALRARLTPAAVWFSGNGAPSAELGIDGDLYRDYSQTPPLEYRRSGGAWAVSPAAALLPWNPRGEWNAGATYAKNDLVRFSGITYLSRIDANTANPPSPGSAQWQVVANTGPQGEKGDRGPQGGKGDTGPRGLTGDKGDTGAQGPQGIRGEKGYEGKKGETGDRGPQGGKGDKGDKGETGDRGPPGPTGAGAGDMLRTSNLSDVADRTQARDNLGAVAAPQTAVTDGAAAVFDGASGNRLKPGPAPFDGRWDSLTDKPDVERRAGSYKGFVLLNAATALEAKHFGCFVQFGGGATAAITLPKADAFDAPTKDAALITIQNYVGLGELPIKAPDNNFIHWPLAGMGGTDSKELKLPPGHTIVMLARGGREWNPVGGSWFDANVTAPKFRDVIADITLTPADVGAILRFTEGAGLKGPVTVTLYDPRKGGAGQVALCNASQYPVTLKNPATWFYRGNREGGPDYILRPGCYAHIAASATGSGDWYVFEAGDPNRIGSFKKFVYVAANNTTLDASYFGCFVSVGIPGSDPHVINLPSAASFGNALEGGTIELENLRDDRDLTIRTPEGDFVYYPPAGLDRDNKGSWPRDLALGPRQTVRMLARGTKEWNPVGGSWRAAQNLKAVARTGSYNDLGDKPTLGTAAAANAADFEKAGEQVGINAQTGTTYTLALSDKGKIVEMGNSAANTLIIPPNRSVAFPVNSRIDLVQLGGGQTTVAPGDGVTIRSAGDKRKLAEQYSGATLYKRSENEWVLAGDLA